MQTYSWRTQLAMGAEGVETVAGMLRRAGYEVVDVTEDDTFQRQDIDLRVRGKRWNTVEVKTDSYDTGNIFLELSTGTSRPGCVFQSRAQWWLYWLPKLNVLLRINLPRLQLWLLTHAANYPQHIVRSKRGNRYWTIRGITVPWTHLVTAGVAYQVEVD